MKTDCEPSEYGDHFVMLSIKKKGQKKRIASKDYEEATVKRVSQLVENSLNQQPRCLIHELQNNFDIFALNNHLNQ
jgi:hypothetical protein